VSAHYVVGKDGVIVQCVPDTEAAWHAGKSTYEGRSNVNAFSIGIEICNLGDHKDEYPAAEYAALGKLMAYLMTTHHVGWNRVTRHRDVATPLGRKDDTSNNFDRKALEKAVAEAGGPSTEPAARRIGLAFPSFN
jgi:N-acetylmuramoyl-L-alanine amidase